LQPRSLDAHNSLASAYAGENQWGEAIQCWRDTLQIDPANIAARFGLAWALATTPDSNLRNGTEALVISQALCQGANASNPTLLRALAAAYAELGRFAEAIETAQRGIEVAMSKNDAQLATILQDDLQLFQSGQPLRDAGKSPKAR
jgi:tetratricopeptide (TPR) repeat protein